MKIRHILPCFVFLTLMGCTSFKTTSVLRLENDSIAKEETCKKLRGIPVKLKIPSHVAVTIYEQQVLLAAKEADLKALKTDAGEAATALKTAAVTLATLEAELQSNQKTIARLNKQIVDLKMDMDVDGDVRAGAILARKETIEILERRNKTLESDTIPKARTDVATKKSAKEVAEERAATPHYALVSFEEPQLMVETKLMYTDKILLVDFRRPAAGILDLTEAKMDDQQYFSNVQADVTERTLADVSTALKTVQGAIVPTPNTAIPTSAITPEGELTEGVDFQKSVVAYQKFDISEPDWELRMNDFIHRHLGCSDATSTPLLDSQIPLPAGSPEHEAPSIIPTEPELFFQQ